MRLFTLPAFCKTEGGFLSSAYLDGFHGKGYNPACKSILHISIFKQIYGT